jgi:hypothetical protein
MENNGKTEKVIKFEPKAAAGTSRRDEGLLELRLAWENLGYTKFATLMDQMEWSIMEVLLLDDFELRFVSSGYVDYPAFPDEDLNQARKVLAAAQKARSLLAGFALPVRRQGESLRRYQARVADDLERHLAAGMASDDASLAGDCYLARCISDPPLGWEE